MNYLHESDLIKRIRAEVADEVARTDRVADMSFIIGVVFALVIFLVVTL